MLRRNVLAAVASALRVPARRTQLHMSASASNGPKHTPDSYAKDEADPTPPPDSTVFCVDSGSSAAQTAYEQVTVDVYSTIDMEEEPYTAPGPKPQQRYGGREGYKAEKGPEASKAGEGPEGKDAEGRKAK